MSSQRRVIGWTLAVMGGVLAAFGIAALAGADINFVLFETPLRGGAALVVWVLLSLGMLAVGLYLIRRAGRAA